MPVCVTRTSFHSRSSTCTECPENTEPARPQSSKPCDTDLSENQLQQLLVSINTQQDGDKQQVGLPLDHFMDILLELEQDVNGNFSKLNLCSSLLTGLFQTVRKLQHVVLFSVLLLKVT